MSNRASQPPRLAIALLKACCSPERLEEIEGDLCELFVRQTAREGVARARRRYIIEVCSISMRQLSARACRGLRRTVIGAVEIHPLRTMASLAFITALLMSSDKPWAVMAWQVLLAIYSLLEVLVYAGALYSSYKRWRTRRRSRAG
jgi:hypothetical protein